MTDLAEQLRAAADDMDGELLPFARMYMQLADRIEAYEVEIVQLEAALKRIASGWPKPMQLARETLEKKK
jgi:hypothetical protein